MDNLQKSGKPVDMENKTSRLHEGRVPLKAGLAPGERAARGSKGSSGGGGGGGRDRQVGESSSSPASALDAGLDAGRREHRLPEVHGTGLSLREALEAGHAAE